MNIHWKPVAAGTLLIYKVSFFKKIICIYVAIIGITGWLGAQDWAEGGGRICIDYLFGIF